MHTITHLALLAEGYETTILVGLEGKDLRYRRPVA